MGDNVVSKPGLFISTSGADRDPWPQDDELRSLRGRGAARAVRAIIDSAPPLGVRDLAAATGTSAATLSRVLELLEREDVIARERRGPVLGVDWQAAIRRWAQDYDQTASNTATTYLEPRGMPALERALAGTGLRYAATGAFAAQRFDPIAPARAAAVYVDDAYEAADRLGLREAGAGANVVLLDAADALAAHPGARPSSSEAYRVACRQPRGPADCLRLLPQRVTGESGPRRGDSPRVEGGHES